MTYDDQLNGDHSNDTLEHTSPSIRYHRLQARVAGKKEKLKTPNHTTSRPQSIDSIVTSSSKMARSEFLKDDESCDSDEQTESEADVQDAVEDEDLQAAISLSLQTDSEAGCTEEGVGSHNPRPDVVNSDAFVTNNNSIFGNGRRACHGNDEVPSVNTAAMLPNASAIFINSGPFQATASGDSVLPSIEDDESVNSPGEEQVLGAFDGARSSGGSSGVAYETHSLELDSDGSIVASPRASSETVEATQSPPPPPRGWPDPSYNPALPFPFFRLPESIRRKIIERLDSPMLTHRRDPISPYFKCGSVHTSANYPCEKGNIDIICLFIGNRAWYNDGANLLYRDNTFDLRNPEMGHWWLKQIGSNLDRLTSLDIYLSVGLVDGKGGRDTRYEKLWLLLLNWLKDRHQLRRLAVSFEAWRRLRREGRWWLDRARWREEIALVLLGFRGMGVAVILPGHWHRPGWPKVGADVWQDIENAWRLPKGAACQAEDAMKAMVIRERDRQGLRGRNFRFD